MPIPPKSPKMEFERIPVYGEWIEGVIDEVEYKAEHKTEWMGNVKVRPAVRFRFTLTDCKWPHRSKWLTLSTYDQAPLYKNFIVPLVKNAKSNMRFELEQFHGMKVKTMWSENEEFDNLDMIKPAEEKLTVTLEQD